jgi:hypothetical protein
MCLKMLSPSLVWWMPGRIPHGIPNSRMTPIPIWFHRDPNTHLISTMSRLEQRSIAHLHSCFGILSYTGFVYSPLILSWMALYSLASLLLASTPHKVLEVWPWVHSVLCSSSPCHTCRSCLLLQNPLFFPLLLVSSVRLMKHIGPPSGLCSVCLFLLELLDAILSLHTPHTWSAGSRNYPPPIADRRSPKIGKSAMSSWPGTPSVLDYSGGTGSLEPAHSSHSRALLSGSTCRLASLAYVFIYLRLTHSGCLPFPSIRPARGLGHGHGQPHHTKCCRSKG